MVKRFNINHEIKTRFQLKTLTFPVDVGPKLKYNPNNVVA